MYYRLIRNLHLGSSGVLMKGTISKLDLPSRNIQVLLDVGAIAEISGPTLSNLTEWEDMSFTLHRHGIVKAEDFLNADTSLLADILYLTDPEVDALKEGLIQDYLVVTSKKGCGC